MTPFIVQLTFTNETIAFLANDAHSGGKPMLVASLYNATPYNSTEAALSDLNALRATVPHTNHATATAHELELSSVLPIDLSGIDRLALLDKVENEIKAAFARMNSMQWNDVLFKAESDRYVELSNKRNELLAQLEQSPE